MNKLTNTVLSATIAASMSAFAFVPAQAAQVYVPQQSAKTSSQAELVQFNDRNGNRMRQDGNWKRKNWKGNGKFERRGNNYYFNGYRGYDGPRRGYREYNGAWFPLAAFAAGALITGAIINQQAPRYNNSGGNAHVQWCYDRYRSYRAYDNTFQPYNGPRQQCYSPYN